jgi:60 kDa SS-A/Ro ribonucleoprotein
MGIKNLFNRATAEAARTPKTDTVNAAGAAAYQNTPETALAKYVTTGMLGGSFYTKPQEDLEAFEKLANAVSPEYLAQAILVGRETGWMRDTPIVGLAILSVRDTVLFRKLFNMIIKNGADAKKFASLMLSGRYRTGKGFGSTVRKAMRERLKSFDSYQFIKYNGKSDEVSLGDIIRLVHPKPETTEQQALFAWAANVTNREEKEGTVNRVPAWNVQALPTKVQAYLEWQELAAQKDPSVETRKRIEELLATGFIPQHKATGAGKMSKEEIAAQASKAPYLETLRSLSKYNEAGLFESDAFTEMICNRITNAEMAKKAMVFPYTYFVAYRSLVAADNPRGNAWYNITQHPNGKNIPNVLKRALGQALENSVKTFSEQLSVNAYVSGDVSGSMTNARLSDSLTANDVSALILSALACGNKKDTTLTLFDTRIRDYAEFDPNASVLTNAMALSKIQGGGTNTALPLQDLLEKGPEKYQLAVFVTDNESWAGRVNERGTATKQQELVQQILKRNNKLKMVFITPVPGTTDQIADHFHENITWVSGFNDQVFRLILNAVQGETGDLVQTIKQTKLP